MIKISDLITKSKTENVLDVALAKGLETLTTGLVNITEFSNYDLKAISVLQEVKHFVPYLNFYIHNKKHIRRKHAKELLTGIKHFSRKVIENSENKRLNMFNR